MDNGKIHLTVADHITLCDRNIKTLNISADGNYMAEKLEIHSLKSIY